MGLKKWHIADYDKELAKELAMECDVDPIVALIASARGYADPYELEQFLSDESVFSDPRECADIEIAADIVNDAIEKGEKIAIFGDYDCDGVTATALLCNFLKAEGADCIYYIPDRFTEGYGMNCDAVKKLAEEGVKLIITVDNGIVCFEEIALAKKLGMRVVVTDHHLPQDTLPEADAVVDPHRNDCHSTFKSVCGAQVVFRLICVMEGREPEELLPYFADILAVAVIADIMPLTLENRCIVKMGVEKLKNAPLTGLSALLNVAGVEQNTVNATKIAFALSPRINAAGRMGSAARAVELLCTDNMLTALGIANEIDADNAKRQQIEKQIFAEAVEIIEKKSLMYDRVIVVSGNDWHHGVVGIVASRICERYGAPAILVSSDGETACGSGRSIEGFSLYNAIDSCRDLMIKFGGHEQAAGVTLKSDGVEEFRKRINEYARKQDYIPPVLELDCKLNPSALSLDLAFAIQQLEPFGSANRVPVFGVYEAVLQRISAIGSGKHLKLLFSKGNNSFQCLLFGVSPDNFCFEIGDTLDLAVTVEPNCYKGEYSVSVQIKAIRMSHTNDDILFKEIEAFNDFSMGADANISLLLPSREQVGEIFKFLSEKPVMQDRLKYLFMNKIGYGKTCIAIRTLQELGLVEINKNSFISAVKGAAKTNLLNSQTYKLLSERGADVDR